MNRKSIWTAIGIVVVIVVLIAIVDKPESNNYKIGIVLPLSGPAGAIGELGKNAVTLALSQLPEKIGPQVEVIYEDDQFDSKKTVTAVTKLIEIDKVDVIITYSSASSVAGSYIAENKSVPMIGLGNSADINKDKKWVTRFIGNPDVYNEALIDLVLDGKYSRPAIIWNQSDGPKVMHDQLVQILPKNTFTLAIDESVTKTENDFRSSIARIKQANPDVIISYLSPQVGVFAKQAKDSGLNIPLVGYLNFESTDQIKASNGALDNQIYVGNDNVEFIKQYYAMFNTYPTVAGDHLFDAVTRASHAIIEAKGDKQEIVDFLREDFAGAAGQYVYMDDGSYDLGNIVAKKWDGERFIVVK